MNKDFIRLDKKNRELCKSKCYLIVADYQLIKDPSSKNSIYKYQQIDLMSGYRLYDLN